jgi:hypothetical protein
MKGGYRNICLAGELARRVLGIREQGNKGIREQGKKIYLAAPLAAR